MLASGDGAIICTACTGAGAVLPDVACRTNAMPTTPITTAAGLTDGLAELRALDVRSTRGRRIQFTMHLVSSNSAHYTIYGQRLLDILSGHGDLG
jgi:hypothetical protein